MSDETASSPETPSEASPAATPRPRRVSAVKAKKAAKTAAPTAEPAAEVTPKETSTEVSAAPAPASADSQREKETPVSVLEYGEGSEVRDQGGSDDSSDEDWPEPDAPATGGTGQQGEGGKRKRRRRKGKGQGNGQQNGGQQPVEEVHALAPGDSKPADAEKGTEQSEQRPRPQHNPQQHQQPQPQRPRIDPEVLAKKAWKIYLAEVSEEGVALIGDNDARELSRRCFKLAEIFVEEQLRRR